MAPEPLDAKQKFLNNLMMRQKNSRTHKGAPSNQNVGCESSPESVVQRQVEAYNAHDVERFLSFYRKDAVLARLKDGTLIARGHDEIRRVYGGLFLSNPGLSCAVLQRIVSGDHVIDKEEITGRQDGKKKIATAIYEIDDELISRTWFL